MEKTEKEQFVILKVLVGSRAHGLADADSDHDYRAVYVNKTSDILSIGHNYKGSSWKEGEEDNTAYELGHFLDLALKCNPTILEVFKAPIVEATSIGRDLRELFPSVWSANEAFNAFTGYSCNQRKKFIEKKDGRQNKFAVAYIRSLANLIQLLSTGDFDVDITGNKYLFENLLRFKKGDYTVGEVIDLAEKMSADAKTALMQCDKESDYDKVNKFLISTRALYW